MLTWCAEYLEKEQAVIGDLSPPVTGNSADSAEPTLYQQITNSTAESRAKAGGSTTSTDGTITQGKVNANKKNGDVMNNDSGGSKEDFADASEEPVKRSVTPTQAPELEPVQPISPMRGFA